MTNRQSPYSDAHRRTALISDSATTPPARERAPTIGDIGSLWEALRRRWPIVLAVTAIAVVAAAAASSLSPNRYTAGASLLFRDPGLDQKLFGTSAFVQQSSPERRAATNARLVSLDRVANATARAFGPGITRAAVRDSIEIVGQGQADIVVVQATRRDPEEAARLANLFAQEYIDFRVAADRATIKSALDLVQSERERLPSNARSERVSLARRAQQLQILSTLQTGNAELVQSATVPTSPSSPRTKRNIAVAFVVGLIAGIGLALLRDRFDRRIHDISRLEAIYGAPTLTQIPKSTSLGAPAASGVPPQDLEAFRILRAQLRFFNIDEPLQTVVVTSAAPADGKSTIAWHLAVSSASAGATEGHRTLLIEADLRCPSIAATRGIAIEAGLSDVLTRGVAPEDAIVTVAVPEGEQSIGVDVLLAGATPPNPAELLESSRMRELLESLRDQYELIIIDTSPLGLVADAMPLIRSANGVLVVATVGFSQRAAAETTSRQLTGLGAHVLGIVANRQQRQPGYGYYGYERGSKNPRVDSDGVATTSTSA